MQLRAPCGEGSEGAAAVGDSVGLAGPGRMNLRAQLSPPQITPRLARAPVEAMGSDLSDPTPNRTPGRSTLAAPTGPK